MKEITQFKNIRLKFLFEKHIGGAWGNDPTEDNSIVCLRAADFITEKIINKDYDLTRRSFLEDEVLNKGLQQGDLIIEKSGGGENQPVGRVMEFSLNEPALCSNFLEILRPNKVLLNPSYGAFLMYSLWATRVVTTSIKQTTGIQNLDTSSYLDNKISIPDLQTQTKITEYLKKETSFIDNLIEIKEQQILLLSEKRQSLINHTVTKGLNSNTKLKDSGIEWLGDIPAHWEIERSKWLFTERNIRSEFGEEEMLTVSHITGVTPRSEKNVNMFEAETNEGCKTCKSGDLVINTLWAWMGAMGIAPIDGIVSPAYHVYTPSERICADYIDCIVRIPVFAKEVTRYSKGVWSSRLRLYPEGFYEVYFPVPPIEEQKEIVKLMKHEIDNIDKLKEATLRSIELLKERRTALITEAVTGQFEIS